MRRATVATATLGAPLSCVWVLSIREQREQAWVPSFFEQWGGMQKSKHGRALLGRTHDEFPDLARFAAGEDWRAGDDETPKLRRKQTVHRVGDLP